MTEAEKLQQELEKQREENKQLVKDKMVAEAQVAELMRQQYRE